jgi:hypothetical protein
VQGIRFWHRNNGVNFKNVQVLGFMLATLQQYKAG